MPRVNVPVTIIGRTPAVPATEVNGDATNNHSVINNGATWVTVRNADAVNAHTVTEVFQKTVDGQAITSKDHSVPASTTHKFRLGATADYNDPTWLNVDSSQLKLIAESLA